MNRHVDLPALEALAKDSRIWRFAHDILGESLVLWRTNVFLGNPVLPWHEDRHAGLFAGDAFSISLMLAIEDSPPDNCVVFARGSHRFSVGQKESRFGIEARRQAFGNLRYSGHVEAKSCEFVPLKAGELIVFHPELMHASSGHVNGLAEVSAERMSIVFRVTTPDASSRMKPSSTGPETKTRCYLRFGALPKSLSSRSHASIEPQAQHLSHREEHGVFRRSLAVKEHEVDRLLRPVGTDCGVNVRQPGRLVACHLYEADAAAA